MLFTMHKAHGGRPHTIKKLSTAHVQPITANEPKPNPNLSPKAILNP